MKDSFPISAAGLTAAQRRLADALIHAGVGATAASRAAVILDEVCANMIRHDPTLGPDAAFDLSAEVGADGVRLEISDPGAPFDPVDHTPDETPRIGGKGLALIRAMAQDLRYERRGASNVVTVVLSLE